MAPRKIVLDYTPDGFAALDAIKFGRVYLTPPRPRTARRAWLSTTVALTPAMDRVLNAVFAKGGIDTSRGPNVPVSLTRTGTALWSEWDTEAMRRGLHPNQRTD